MTAIRTLRISLAFIGSFTVFPAATLAETFDAGIILGDPTGLSFKGWLNNVDAYDIAASWSTDGRDKRYIHADYLRHDYTLLKVPHGDLPVYYGIGARVLDRDNRKTRAGIRIPLGLDYQLYRLPLSLFIEVAPRLDLTPDTDFELEGALGVRYRFFMPETRTRGNR